MTGLKSEFLGVLHIRVAASYEIGVGPTGRRRIDVFEGGTFLGPRIHATIVDGTDVLRLCDGGIAQPNVRLILETEDGAAIFVSYRGIRHASADVMDRIASEVAMPESHEYYLRNAIFFETGAENYTWLNRVLAVGVGRRSPRQADYDVYEIL